MTKVVKSEFRIKRICLIIHSLSPGGMERVMSQLAAYLAQKDEVEVHLVLYGIKREVFYPLPKSIQIHRPKFIFSNRRRVWHTIKTLFFLRRTIQRIKPYTVLSFGEIWNNLVLLALYKLHVPVYVSDRSQPGKDLGILHNILKNLLYPTAAGLISQTNKAREIAKQNKRNTNIIVIGNPIRDVIPGPDEKKENIILTVGRLIRTKHPDELIRLFVRLDQTGWRLVIVGGDAQRQNLMAGLQELVQHLDAENIIEFVGTQSDVDSYYQKSKIFAFTSSSEGFPNVIGEAMSAGLPVVSFDCVAGPSEMIEDEVNGFLVDVFDYDSFERRLKQLMDNVELRNSMGGKALKSIQQFSVEEISEQFYSAITGEKSS